MRPAFQTLSVLSLGLASACAGAWSVSDEGQAACACAGLDAAAVDRTVDDLRANVEGVEPLHDGNGPKVLPHTVGASVQVRAVPGMTASWLGRVLQCDAAHRGTLVPAGAESEVSPTPTGFSVAVRSRDPDVAREIVLRARAFARQPSASSPATDRAQ
jgi:hypothetical protein